MHLHEAVRKARKELGLSQQKLAEQAGIQRRQLATLESGGNVTLATVRKVIAQLPNLQSFMVDAVQISPGRTPTTLADSILVAALSIYSRVIATIANCVVEGNDPGPNEISMLDDAHAALKHAIQAKAAAREVEAEGVEWLDEAGEDSVAIAADGAERRS